MRMPAARLAFAQAAFQLIVIRQLHDPPADREHTRPAVPLRTPARSASSTDTFGMPRLRASS